MRLSVLFEEKPKIGAKWWTPELTEIAVTMKAYGYSLKEIAEKISEESGLEVSINGVKAKIQSLRRSGKIVSSPDKAGYVNKRHISSGVDWTPEIINKMWDLKREGLSNKEIGLELEIKPQAINDKIKKLKSQGKIPPDIRLNSRKSYFKWDDATTWKLWDYIRKGYGLNEISDYLNVKKQTVIDKLRTESKWNRVPPPISI